jgi:hypothetical protein
MASPSSLANCPLTQPENESFLTYNTKFLAEITKLRELQHIISLLECLLLWCEKGMILGVTVIIWHSVCLYQQN